MSIVERKNFQNLEEKETTEIGERSLQDAETKIMFMNSYVHKQWLWSL